MPDTSKCAGLFAPCDNPPDPSQTVEDPDSVEPPVLLCTSCGGAANEMFARVFSDPRLTEEFAFAVEAAHRANASGGDC